MEHLGLVANVGGRYPSAEEWPTLNPAWFRSIVYRTADLKTALAAMPASTSVIALVNNEHERVGWNWDGLEAALEELVALKDTRIKAVEIGNELDLHGDSPAKAAGLATRAHPILKKAGVKTILSSVAGSDWVNWLREASKLAAGSIDGTAIHPYGAAADGYPSKSYLTGDLAQKIDTALSVGGLPVWITEMGVKLGEIGGEANAAEWLRRAMTVVGRYTRTRVPAACFFAYHDANGAPYERGLHAFGMIEDETERQRASYAMFASLGTQRSPAKPPVQIPPPPKLYHVGQGVSLFLSANGLKATGNELYFNAEMSATPTDKGMVFWSTTENRARLIGWTN